MNPASYTFNQFHLGDCLISLHLIRALAQRNRDTQFVFFAHGCNLDQLKEAVADLPTIHLFSFDDKTMWENHRHEAVNMWKNADDAWTSSPLQYNWSSYTLWHHAAIARKMGLESPFTCREHLLFDYPALTRGKVNLEVVDFLIGDSAPSSGQYSEWADHSKNPLIPLIEVLRNSGKSVQLASAFLYNGMTITGAGQESMLCRNHIMVANGPFWPTLNTTNHHHHEGRKRIVLLDNGESINMPHIEQCSNVEEVFQIAREEKWI